MIPPATVTGTSSLSLRLFIDDDSATARRALLELQALRSELALDAEVEVVDIRADPDAAERERVLAVPALDRLRPLPVQRIIGDLRDHATVAAVLAVGTRE